MRLDLLKQRIITAAVLAPAAIAAIFLLPLNVFHFVMVAVSLIAAWEWAGFSTPGNTKKRKLQLGLFGVIIAVMVSFLPPNILPVLLDQTSTLYVMLFAGVWWVIVLLMALSFPRSALLWEKQPAINFMFGCFTLLPFLWAMLALRSWHYEDNIYHGGGLLLYVMLLVWGADTGAYFSGRMFGKHKLAPQVSPGKTIEGLIGGVVVAMMISMLFCYTTGLQLHSVPALVTASLLAVLASALGDLNESMFKRTAGVKDSGTILPGHGGVLDRIDSLTAALPIFTLIYLLWH